MSLRKLKWLILILSGLTFIYLISFNFSTINDHKDFQVYMQKLKVISENLVRKGWDDTTVAQWRRSLEMRGRPGVGKCDFNNIVVALPGDSLEDYLWEYLSLLVLRERWKYTQNVTMGVFLAPKSRRALAGVLEELQVDSVQMHPSSCLDLKHATILGHVNQVEVAQFPLAKPQMFLLEKGAKRYKELIHSDLTWLRGLFVLKERLQQEMRQKIFKVREFFSSNTTEASEIYLVGLHLGSNRIPQAVPVDFYQTAIQSVQLWHEDAGVLILCPQDKTPFCRETFGAEERIKILESEKDPGEDFALLTLCDGNILRSDLGFLAAILNDGETVVFQSHASENDPAAQVAHFRPKWFMLEN